MIPVTERHLCSDAWRATFGRNERKRQGRDWMRVEDHEAWQRTIAHMHWDVFLACRPDFNLVEGIVGRDGNAFYQGRNFSTGLAVAGESMAAVDLVAAISWASNRRTWSIFRSGSNGDFVRPRSTT